MVTSHEMVPLIAEAVKVSFQNQFNIDVFGFVDESDAIHNQMGKVLGAKLCITSQKSRYEFFLFVPVEMAKSAISTLLNENFEEEDPEVWESVGEFLNIVSGSLCKQINERSETKYELQCPVFFPRMNSFDKRMLDKSSSCAFESKLGTIVFGYKIIAIEGEVHESKC